MRKTKPKENLYVIEGKLYPTKKQEVFFAKTFGCVRFTRNHYTYGFIHPIFEETDEIITLKNGEEGKKRIYEKPLTLGNLKKIPEYSFLKEVDSLALCNTKLNFEMVKRAFLSEEKHELKDKIKKKLEKESDYMVKITDYKGCPRFIRKHDVQSYTTNNLIKKIKHKDGTVGISQTIELLMTRQNEQKGYIKLPKIGWIKVTLNRKVKNTEIQSVTIKKLKSGVYKISILVKSIEIISEKKRVKPTENQIGIDLGIKDYLIDSNGNKFENPKFLHKSEEKLKKAQRALSRKQCSKNSRSKNYEKQCVKVAKIHEKIANQRKDYHHKLSTKYVNENQVIYLENLNVKGMMKNHKLAKAISDCGWSDFVRMLEYKAKWQGKEITKIDRFYPSSKTCSVCGYKKEDLTLKERFWECPECKTVHDRDVNAAINILKEGQRVKNTAVGTTVQACATTSQ